MNDSVYFQNIVMIFIVLILISSFNFIVNLPLVTFNHTHNDNDFLLWKICIKISGIYSTNVEIHAGT